MSYSLLLGALHFDLYVELRHYSRYDEKFCLLLVTRHCMQAFLAEHEPYSNRV